jgi:hypothetical protein
MLDGSKSVRDIVQQGSGGEFSVYQTLYAMATSKLIHAVDKPKPVAAPKKAGPDEDLATILPVYHDVAVTISRHLQDQLGEGYCDKVLEACKLSLPKENQPVVNPYQVQLSALENVNKILGVVNRLYKGAAALSVVGHGFNKFIACLLLQEAEILGAKQTLQTIGRVHELLGVVEKYRGGEGKLRLVRALKETVSKVAARLGG